MIKINNDIRDKLSCLAIASISLDVKVQSSDNNLVNILTELSNTIAESECIEDIAKISAIRTTREAYKRLGKQPSRYRVSSEALHRRIVQGKGIYFINNIVDINNYISIKSGYGICVYDMDKVVGKINFRIAKEGETYRGIGKYDLNLENLPVFSDDIGCFGSPTSDSERTMITDATKRISFNIVSFSGKSDMTTWIDEAVFLLKKYAYGKNIETHIYE